MARRPNETEPDEVRRANWREVATIMHRPGLPDAGNVPLPERVEVAGGNVRAGRKGKAGATAMRLPRRTIVLGRDGA